MKLNSFEAISQSECVCYGRSE